MSYTRGPNFSRRASGTYSFGYPDMNTVLRSAHFERLKREREKLRERTREERIGVVCLHERAVYFLF
jgi:hypothetical protein